MRTIRKLRDRRNRRRFPRLGALYSNTHTPEEIQATQLERFNDVWPSISSDSPFYAELKRRNALPDRFEDWSDFSEAMPILDRSSLKSNLPRIPLAHARPGYWRMTGGTTAEPLRLPAWNREDRITTLNTWFARSWFGAGAADRLFLLWGHSHLFGEGLAGKLNLTARRIKDACLDYLRFSAYDLSEGSMRYAAKRLLQHRPSYILGYATALHRLAQFNQDRKDEFKRLGLKVAIATGESYPDPGSEGLVSDVLGCSVVMEYGAMETGAIAHQRPSGEFQVFWGSYYVEGMPSAEDPELLEVVVTALYPRLTPLIRYRIGDLVAANREHSGVGTHFDKVIGRANDGIIIDESGFVHSEAFTHALRDIDRIHAFQVVQRSDRDISINYTSTEVLSPDTTQVIRRRLSRIDERLNLVSINRVPAIEPTAAGKTKRIVNFVNEAGRDAP